MKNSLRSLLLTVVVMVSVVACAGSHHHKAASPQMSPTVTVELIHASTQCGARGVGVSAHWIEDSAQFESLYRRLDLPSVEIDFTQSLLVMVEMGERPTLGYRLGLAQPEALMVEGHAEVVLDWHEPPRGMMVAQVMTSPCLLLKLERADYREVWVKDTDGHRRAVTFLP